ALGSGRLFWSTIFTRVWLKAVSAKHTEQKNMTISNRNLSVIIMTLDDFFSFLNHTCTNDKSLILMMY
ncbi:MAG: hypothetical protein ACI9N3_000931, partial [Colwellia sp.]